MQAADTNVLARVFVYDASAPAQCRAAQHWFANCRAVFVPQVVQMELVWLLDRVFALSRKDIASILEALQAHPAVTLQALDAFESARLTYQSGGDFADGLILFEANRANAALFTFDVNFAKRSGAQLLSV